MTYAFFLGCIMPLRYPGIESSTRGVFKALGVDFKDVKGFSCCPAPGVTKSFDRDTWLALGARNLVQAQQQGLDVITVCNGCYGTLFDVKHMLDNDPKLLEKVNGLLAKSGVAPYNPGMKVRHFAEVLFNEVGVDKIKKSTKTPQKFKVGIHYGCHFLKPSRHKKIDDPERPHILESLVEAVGATSVDYKNKDMCCGAGGGVRARNKDLAMALTKDKLDGLKEAGVDMIIDVCPFCHLQYDMGQKELPGYNIPVLHLSQLYGLAMGLDKSQLGLELHSTPVKI